MAQSPLTVSILSHRTVKTRVAQAYPHGVKPSRVDVHLVAIPLYLVAKLILKVPLPMLAYALWLSGKVIELTSWCHLILSPRTGWCKL
jgi:hypothetical protein